ncbi:hypothetical protein RHS04_08214 [Rhizoctonia solani]|uniref:F-box domain-containing protein n=1 Tax=Rhizoctonia solani TaxID=456999 RepID=A0A8H7H0X9_9AGAM|nr:hypothetical protein RHS04_08214 [Rhizoctonia solani]
MTTPKDAAYVSDTLQYCASIYPWVKSGILAPLQSYFPTRISIPEPPLNHNSFTLVSGYDKVQCQSMNDPLGPSFISPDHGSDQATNFINRMPIEIIGKIFELAITGSSAGLSMRRAIEETCLCLYNIAGVCRGWRAAVLAQTSLWNLIPIICYRGRHRTFITMRSAALAIERAECSNMRLAADLGLFRPAGSPVLEQLFRIKPRIHYVNLRTSGYFNLEEILNPIIEIAGIDAITELSLCFEPSAVFMSERPDSYVLFGHNMDSQLPLFELSLGSVKVLRLKNVIFRAPNASLGILRELRLQDIMFDNSIALMETLKPLSTASRLERLDFIKIEVNDVNSHTPIPDISILLPNLRTLNIEDMSYEATHTVLCCIKPGSYQTVLLFSSILLGQLGINIDSDKQNQCNILEQAIQPHGHSTLVIRTEGNDIESRALYELLHRLPSLTRVQIHTTSLSLALCSTLTQHPDPADLATGFPQFSQIYLNSESIHNIHEWQDSFVQMLSSHPLEEVILGGALRVLASEAFNVTGSWLQNGTVKIRSHAAFFVCLSQTHIRQDIVPTTIHTGSSDVRAVNRQLSPEQAQHRGSRGPGELRTINPLAVLDLHQRPPFH